MLSKIERDKYCHFVSPSVEYIQYAVEQTALYHFKRFYYNENKFVWIYQELEAMHESM